MAHYFVGDVQGCFTELQKVLEKVDFNPSQDELWAVGDLVARGPDSLATLRFFKSLGDSAKTVLGNHDLHLMAIHGKLKRDKPSDNLKALLKADDINELIDWLRQQPLMRELPEQQLIMTHAGVPPQWSLETLRQESALVSHALKQDDYLEALISQMYTDTAERWEPTALGIARLRFCINALTRMRYLYVDGHLNFDCKQPPQDCTDPQLRPWYEYTSPLRQSHTLVFGHWAALMGNVNDKKLKALDTGCCWGEHLTLWHLEKDQKITQKRLKKS
ncbi:MULTISPECIES: symmetrical bis(5'-nucleosyl)-tetraphosphatase [Shewanella]|uniref:Bis(5'-nucleosyl)-tetraphosphatase, symmetrical n=2 Tax=Shewanella TaxID=22 RepID=APAH_SHESW|nr:MULTISPECIES: symmetrical bis(5'-nucleosyl)-tetraphosphatase [Shewanella]A1RMV0.1 RecName: Full=Bis(5'-nucleosyl)-tetraphosphatase, symmetrical; AltName: Full=Ap4A hydrolase; AltName: Full=Diadenosine 5',5'''-P1,P4-tetraphosphate pyrophosphohydrolase; AltName: Full=Diadenosine tetraphosphatase [Shewanella sp. W3-18-1]ABM25995.1 Bis(5'nucleosyl)-tetraphosphatase, ApaH [Shewanella sp. W3-18-1]MDR6963741.1 bis(5'-nucleosyl)-tetraphosphatase (symmetrical) [Shewanella putrefaciens]